MTAPTISKQQEQFTGDAKGPLTLYRELMVGERGWGAFVWYEILTGVGGLLPGVVGHGFRTATYPTLFSKTGKRPVFGAGVQLRNPGGTVLGDKVLIDDRATIDCRAGSKITLGDYVAIGRDTIIAAKGGDIDLAPGVNIGSQCRVATQSGVTIGESTLIAAYAYIGPGNHIWDEATQSFIAGEMELKGGVTIGKNVWIGARATILDGVTIGDGAVVAAHALVKDDVPPQTTVAGIPAKVIGQE